MSDKKLYRLVHKTARAMAVAHIESAPEGYTVEIREPRRSDAANAKMHAMLGDVAKQVTWCGATLSAEDWKRVATAMLKKDKFVRDVGEDGQPGNGLIVVGARTREMSGSEISDVIEWLKWFGAQHNVAWSDEKALQSVQELRRG